MLLAMMVAALSFTACGGDEDKIDGNTSSLVGTWKLLNMENYIQFKNDGSFIEATNMDNFHGTWKVTGNTLLLSNDGRGYAMTFSIEIKSNKYLTMELLSYYFLSNPSDVFDYDNKDDTITYEKVNDSEIVKYIR